MRLICSVIVHKFFFPFSLPGVFPDGSEYRECSRAAILLYCFRSGALVAEFLASCLHTQLSLRGAHCFTLVSGIQPSSGVTAEVIGHPQVPSGK